METKTLWTGTPLTFIPYKKTFKLQINNYLKYANSIVEINWGKHANGKDEKE